MQYYDEYVTKKMDLWEGNMRDFKNMTPEEIVKLKDEYENRIRRLEGEISNFMGGDHSRETIIHNDYKNLKEEIREMGTYFDALKNSIREISKTHAAFQDGVRGAGAFGFCKRAGSRINQELFNACEEAEYRLNKYFW